mgnify:CR=1 FL=1
MEDLIFLLATVATLFLLFSIVDKEAVDNNIYIKFSRKNLKSLATAEDFFTLEQWAQENKKNSATLEAMQFLRQIYGDQLRLGHIAWAVLRADGTLPQDTWPPAFSDDAAPTEQGQCTHCGARIDSKDQSCQYCSTANAIIARIQEINTPS